MYDFCARQNIQRTHSFVDRHHSSDVCPKLPSLCFHSWVLTSVCGSSRATARLHTNSGNVFSALKIKFKSFIIYASILRASHNLAPFTSIRTRWKIKKIRTILKFKCCGIVFRYFADPFNFWHIQRIYFHFYECTSHNYTIMRFQQSNWKHEMWFRIVSTHTCRLEVTDLYPFDLIKKILVAKVEK